MAPIPADRYCIAPSMFEERMCQIEDVTWVNNVFYAKLTWATFIVSRAETYPFIM